MQDLELMDLEQAVNVLWEDRPRILGIPAGFTAYRLSPDRIFVESGFMNIKEEQILLYRVQDLQWEQSFWQRLLNIGTVCVYSTDKTTPIIKLVNIKYPRKVKELIHRQVEDARLKRKVRLMEIVNIENSRGAHFNLDNLDAHIDDQDLSDPEDPHSMKELQEELGELDGKPEE